MASISYLIKGGTLIDGSGFPMTQDNVAISGETIKTVGAGSASGATRVIDATGKYVIPGIIDITNHSDTHWSLFLSPSQESLLRQGITTIVGGVCGSSLAPLADAQAIRAIQKWTDLSKVNINWQTQEEFFMEIERHALGVNFGTLVGHGTLRRGIANDRIDQLTPSELESMKLLLRRSLDEGALGLSIGLTTSHGSVASQEEIIGLAKVVTEARKFVSIHLRNEGRRILSSVVEAVNIARQSGSPVHIVHLKGIGRKAWNDFRKALAIIRKATKDEHLPITVDFFPYLRTGSLLYTLLPEWMREGGKEKILKVLANKERHPEVIESIQSLTLHYENIIVSEAHKDKHAIGKSIARIASESGLTPEETLAQLLIVNELGVSIFGRTLRGKNIVSLAKESYSMFGSDGVGESDFDTKKKGNLTHPRSYGAAPRFLNRLVKRGKVLSWEEAVRKMTSMPAELLGLKESHGLIKKGYAADLVIFDPEELTDTATYRDPFQYPKGIDYVFINGRLALEKGVFTGALAGKILRQS